MNARTEMSLWNRLSLICLFVSTFCAGISARAEAVATQPFSLDLLALGSSPAVTSTSGSVARDTSIRIRGFGLSSQVSGNIDFHSAINVVNAINNIDLEDTLGMDLDEFSGGAMVGFDWGGDKQFHLNFTYWGNYNFDGSRDVGSIIFDGQLFNGEVDSKAQLIEGDIDFRWDFWRPESNNLTLSMIVGLNTYYIQAEVEESLTGRTGSTELLAPIPVLGLSMRWDITPNLYLQGNAAGLYAGNYGNYYDLSAEVGYDFNKTVGVFAGYRYWSLNLDWNDDIYDASNGSIFAGVELRL